MHHPAVPKQIAVRMIAYFLSRYNKKAAIAVGSKNTTKAFENIGGLLETKPSTVKNLRDSFDPYLPQGERKRKGWHQRALTPIMRLIQRHLEPLDFEHCSEVIISLITVGSPLHPITIEILDDLESAGIENPPDDEASQEIEVQSEIEVELSAICNAFQEALDESGLLINESLSRSFLAALVTKRFAILTGLSGSGKTQLAQKLGEWFGPEHAALIPVRPDWTGPEHLLGYEDGLTKPDKDGHRPYHAPRVLEFMLKAQAESDYPHLLILDEMNLAHVERYFADILSGIESGDDVLPNLVNGKDGRFWPVKDKAKFIPLPTNLFIIGTVNVDETTYMFSPKVLDRANTFEFRVESKSLQLGMARPTRCEQGAPELVKGLLALAKNDSFHQDHAAPYQDAFAKKLVTLHELLARYDWEFGYRVFYEANRFAALLAATGPAELTDALDAQVMQKILPRLHGNRRRLEATLCALGTFCLTLEYDDKADHIKQYNKLDDDRRRETAPASPLLPSAYDKVRRMLQNLRNNQFASFTE